MYKIAQLTDAQIAKFNPDLRREIESLKSDSDNFDPELYEVFAENDKDLYELAKGELAGEQPAVTSAAEPVAPLKRGPKTKEKRAKKQAEAYSETVKIGGTEYLVGAGPVGTVQYGLDKNGQILPVGDTVEATIKG